MDISLHGKRADATVVRRRILPVDEEVILEWRRMVTRGR